MASKPSQRDKAELMAKCLKDDFPTNPSPAAMKAARNLYEQGTIRECDMAEVARECDLALADERRAGEEMAAEAVVSADDIDKNINPFIERIRMHPFTLTPKALREKAAAYRAARGMK